MEKRQHAMAFFEHGEIKIAFDDIGVRDARRTILLVHGFATNRVECWRRLGWYGAFERKRFRTVALDCRGHGESSKPHDASCYSRDVIIADIFALMDHLGVSRADVMGYSMGARIALAAAQSNPARFDHVVFGGIGGRMLELRPGDNGMAEAMEAADADGIADPLLRSFRHFADEQGEDRQALAALARARVHSAEATSAYAALQRTVLVVAGARDALAGDPQQLADEFPNARAVALPGCDHFSALPHALFKAAVFDFLDDELD